MDPPPTKEPYLGFIAQPERAVWGFYRPINLDIAPFGLREQGVEHVEGILTHDDSEGVCWVNLYMLGTAATGATVQRSLRGQKGTVSRVDRGRGAFALRLLYS